MIRSLETRSFSYTFDRGELIVQIHSSLHPLQGKGLDDLTSSLYQFGELLLLLWSELPEDKLYLSTLWIVIAQPKAQAWIAFALEQEGNIFQSIVSSVAPLGFEP